MKARYRRFGLLAAGVVSAGLACALVLNALRSNMMFFVTPSQVASHEAPLAHRFRLGGLVERHSLRRDADGLTVHFTVSDTASSVRVVYRGALPDLFREGSGVVAQGRLGDDGQFHADEVLAKHDEKYMPPEVSSALRQAAGSAQPSAQPGAQPATKPAAVRVAAGVSDGGVQR
ncbi:Cytochrome c-type biogenesis protein CcmE [Paraburkholderia caffeinitolerans]|uniref:Cytochrome c-type biogenesis protein CcmE n=1 Tax=Paraburkholderia caffeinitolerans TaxID=1723730 RepID=A0A6J5FG92_9BURK|nr:MULTISPECIES: cytochrome c maturation protein CcmE [Paraburkholderia]CAB3778983.1 Cytochrome c-type biogenesis protein CcmE [Paraburkholderia caffeinitolerans]